MQLCVCDTRILAHPTPKGPFPVFGSRRVPRRASGAIRAVCGPEEGGTWSDGGLFLFAEKDASHMGSPQTQADLSQDPEGSGGQEGELAS